MGHLPSHWATWSHDLPNLVVNNAASKAVWHGYEAHVSHWTGCVAGPLPQWSSKAILIGISTWYPNGAWLILVFLLLLCEHEWKSCFQDQNRYNICILQPSQFRETTCDRAAAPWLLGECQPWVAETPQTHLATVCAWDVRVACHTTHTAYPCLSTMPGHVFLWDLLCMCDLLCSAHQQLSPTPSEQPLKVTWASCVPSDRRDISHSMSQVIFWVVGAYSQGTGLEPGAWGSREKGGSAPHEQTGLLEQAARDQWWLAFHILDEPGESGKQGWPLRDLDFSWFLSPFPSPCLKSCGR